MGEAVPGWLRRAGRLAAVLLLVQLGSVMPARADAILVFAAASLKDALDAADVAYQKQSGVKVTASFAASGALAKQIDNGAPADLFISADERWMDFLAGTNRIRPDSRVDLLGNRLVMIAPADSTIAAHPARGLDLKGLLGEGRLAIGDPAYVPAGGYAKAALQSLGLWDSVAGRLARAENVRAALALVARGEAPLGIVYASDVGASRDVRVLGAFPESSHPPIVYPAALTAGAPNPAAARAYLAWLRSPAAAPYFRARGFVVLPAPG